MSSGSARPKPCIRCRVSGTSSDMKGKDPQRATWGASSPTSLPLVDLGDLGEPFCLGRARAQLDCLGPKRGQTEPPPSAHGALPLGVLGASCIVCVAGEGEERCRHLCEVCRGGRARHAQGLLEALAPQVFTG